MHACMHVCMCVCIYIYMYIYIYRVEPISSNRRTTPAAAAVQKRPGRPCLAPCKQQYVCMYIEVMICLPPQGTRPPHSSRYGPQHTQHTASTAATPHYPQGRRQTPEMYAPMYACVFVYVYMYRCLQICMHGYVCMSVCMHACMYACMYAYMYVIPWGDRWSRGYRWRACGCIARITRPAGNNTYACTYAYM